MAQQKINLTQDPKIPLLRTLLFWLLAFYSIGIAASIVWVLPLAFKLMMLGNLVAHILLVYYLEGKNQAFKYVLPVFSVSLVANWIFAAGILGPAPYVLIAYGIILGVIAEPGKQITVGVPIYGGVVGVLLLLQVYYPEAIMGFDNTLVQQKLKIGALLFLILLLAIVLRRRTAQFKLEKELLAKERQKLQEIINALPQIIRLKDEDGEVFLSNEAKNPLSGEMLDQIFDAQEDSGEALPQQIQQTGQWVLAQKITLERYGINEEDAELEIVTDITDLMRANIALTEANDELRRTQSYLMDSEKMASLGVMMAGITHEINNPLNFVQLGVANIQPIMQELIDEWRSTNMLVRPEWEEQVKMLEELIFNAHRGLERMNDIVQSMGIFARKGSDRLTWIDLNKCIDAVLVILHHQYKERITIVKKCHDLPPVECDASAMNQVFMNLLVNAIHAIKGHGSIIIETQHCDDTVSISITDTGEGIPENIGKEIFKPFFTSKPLGVGTGLGLSIVMQVLNAHKGGIFFQSQLGAGTTFTITLPVTQH